MKFRRNSRRARLVERQCGAERNQGSAVLGARRQATRGHGCREDYSALELGA
jgi:hypothetical protein